MRRTGWVLVLGLVAAGPAGANVGSPTIVAIGLHLIFGNLLIAALESAIIVLLWRARPRRLLFLVLLIANLLSALVGCVLLPGWLIPWTVALAGEPPELRWRLAGAFLWAMCFLLSVSLEWPLIHWALRRPRWTESISRCVLANVASHLILIGWYAVLSAHTLFDGVRFVAPEQLPSDEAGRLAVVDAAGRVQTMRLNGSDRWQIGSVSEPVPGIRLHLTFDQESEPPAYHLTAVSPADNRPQRLAESIAPGPATDWFRKTPLLEYPDEPPTYHSALMAGAKQVRAHAYPWHGFWGWNSDGTVHLHWMFEDPALAVFPVDIVGLPNGCVVFQLAYARPGQLHATRRFPQVYVLDMERGVIAVVARGESAVAYWTGPHQEAVQ